MTGVQTCALPISALAAAGAAHLAKGADHIGTDLRKGPKILFQFVQSLRIQRLSSPENITVAYTGIRSRIYYYL